MFHPRVFAVFAAALTLLAVAVAHAGSGGIGIEPIAEQNIPSGKTLVIPIPATDPTGPARSYTVTVGPATTVSGTTTVSATAAGIHATIRTGDPHMLMGVNYAVSGTGANAVLATGTMEFQLLREFAPTTAQTIGGIAAAGYYSPFTSGTNPTRYIVFNRVVPGFVIQLGDPSGDGRGGLPFNLENEYNSALVFSGSEGQVAMAHGGTIVSGTDGSQSFGATNNSQFFVTLGAVRSLDFGYTFFGQLIRGFDTLNGIAGTPLDPNNPNNVGGSAEYSRTLTPVKIISVAVNTNNTDAVLLLSATGVCDAPITVIATTGTVSTTGTFTAHAVADSMSDPSFLSPVPNITAPNGNVKVALQQTDLQLDYLRYGFDRVDPAVDPAYTTGSSPLVTIPLVSNTDNAVEAVGAHWNAPSSSFDNRVFHVGAGDKPIRGKITPIPAGSMGVEKIASPFTAAVFTAGNTKDAAKSFITSVNWGDGTLSTGTASGVSVIKDTSARTVNRFKLVVTGSGGFAHQYLLPGEYIETVKISDLGGAYLTLTGTVNVGASTIAISPQDFFKTGGVLKNQQLGTFTDLANSVGAGGYTTTINWGDGIVSSGTLKAITADSYRILGTHSYGAPATYTVSTTVARTGTSGYSGSALCTAHIAGVVAPQIFPPFPQAHLAQVWSPLYSDSNTVITKAGDSGGNPYSVLIEGTNGNLYGTTRNGGADGFGAVFEIHKDGSSINTLHVFTGGTDGGFPVAGVIQAADGNFYGTTGTGGANGFGVVYQLAESGSMRVLHSFTGTDGANPVAALVAGTDGFFYGTTPNSTNGESGTVFSVNTTGTFNVLHTFTGGADGGAPTAPLFLDQSGSFYGTTSTSTSGTGPGTIFRISSGGSLVTVNTLPLSGTVPVLGETPLGGLVSGTDGNFYGTTSAGGANGFGTIYRLTASGTMSVVYAFTGGNDGGAPVSGLTSGTDGLLYGTTPLYGANGVGTIFSVSTSGAFTTLYSFTRNGGGRDPQAPPTLASDGNFYGTTQLGGDNGYGVVYQASVSGGSYNPIFSFTSGDTFQILLRGAVDIINSGNRTSSPATFSLAYNDGSGANPLSVNGQSVFPVNNGKPLAPGQFSLISFTVQGAVSDTRAPLPVAYDPTGDTVTGTVNYTDPVGDFDGSEKSITLPGTL
jgi:uncharacterized repeat protein (TIGR03803 family)